MNNIDMDALNELVEFYVSTWVVIHKEDALDKLVLLTNGNNYMKIVTAIENHDNSSELELSMYIHEIAAPEYGELLPIIKLKLNVF
jgi:hypothetical protein